MLFLLKSPAPQTRTPASLFDSLPAVNFQPIDGSGGQKRQNAIFLREIQERGFNLMLTMGFSQDDALKAGRYAGEHYPRSWYPPNTVNASTDSAYRSEVWERYLSVLFKAPARKIPPHARAEGVEGGFYEMPEVAPAQGRPAGTLLGQLVPEKAAIKGLPPKETGVPAQPAAEAKPATRQKEEKPPAQKTKMAGPKKSPRTKDMAGKELVSLVENLMKERVSISAALYLDNSESVVDYCGKIKKTGDSIQKVSKKYENQSFRCAYLPQDAVKGDLDNCVRQLELILNRQSNYNNQVFISDGGNLPISPDMVSKTIRHCAGTGQRIHVVYPSYTSYDGPIPFISSKDSSLLGALIYLAYKTGGFAFSIDKIRNSDYAGILTADSKKNAYSDVFDFMQKNSISPFLMSLVAISQNDIGLLRQIVSKDPKTLSEQYNGGGTVLHYAAYYGKLDAVKFICSKDPNAIRAKNKVNQTPMHEAVLAHSNGSSLDIVKFLHSKDPNLIYEKDLQGLTPAHYAAGRGAPNMFKFFCSKSPGIIHAKDNDGKTPIFFATGASMDYYLEGGEGGAGYFSSDQKNPANIRLWAARLEVVKFIHSKDPNAINAKNRFGLTPLRYVREGIEVAKFLIWMGADPGSDPEFRKYRKNPALK